MSTKFPLVPGLYRILASVLLVIGADLPIVHHPHYQYYMSSLINRLAQLSNDVLVSAIQVKKSYECNLFEVRQYTIIEYYYKIFIRFVVFLVLFFLRLFFKFLYLKKCVGCFGESIVVSDLPQ